MTNKMVDLFLSKAIFNKYNSTIQFYRYSKCLSRLNTNVKICICEKYRNLVVSCIPYISNGTHTDGPGMYGAIGINLCANDELNRNTHQHLHGYWIIKLWWNFLEFVLFSKDLSWIKTEHWKCPSIAMHFPLFHTGEVIAWKNEMTLSNSAWRQNPDSKVHGANMGPTWVLSAPDGPHVGPMNLAIRVGL